LCSGSPDFLLAFCPKYLPFNNTTQKRDIISFTSPEPSRFRVVFLKGVNIARTVCGRITPPKYN
jgi:hypothetical protein